MTPIDFLRELLAQAAAPWRCYLQGPYLTFDSDFEPGLDDEPAPAVAFGEWRLIYDETEGGEVVQLGTLYAYPDGRLYKFLPAPGAPSLAIAAARIMDITEALERVARRRAMEEAVRP